MDRWVLFMGLLATLATGGGMTVPSLRNEKHPGRFDWGLALLGCLLIGLALVLIAVLWLDSTFASIHPLRTGGISVAISSGVFALLVLYVRHERRTAPATACAVPLGFGGVEPGSATLKRRVGAKGIEVSPIQMIWVHVRNEGEQPNQVAKEVMAVVHFYRPDGSSMFKFRGRWRESKERHQVESWRDIPDLMDIGAAQEFTLDIAFKYEHEALAFAVNTKSTELAPDWRYVRWKLPAGHCLVRVGVKGTNTRSVVGWFSISNPGDSDLTVAPTTGFRRVWPFRRGVSIGVLEATRAPAIPVTAMYDFGHIGYQGFTSAPLYAGSGILPAGTAVMPQLPTIADIQKRADWILAHPNALLPGELPPLGRAFSLAMGAPRTPHEAWELARRELTAEFRELTAEDSAPAPTPSPRPTPRKPKARPQ